jgi:methylenetetrahydrofolate reductase (NADPH)
MTRIIDKINARRRQFKTIRPEQADEAIVTDDSSRSLPSPGWYYSFEYFPPKTEAGLDNLLTRIDRMTRRLDPLFIDVTWGTAGSTSARTLSVASYAQRYCGVDVLMHLSCTGMNREQISNILQQAKSCGVHNILALRGDPPKGKRSWDVGDVSGGECQRAIDLVRLIRSLHGDYFGIAVAGHPEGHPSSTSMEEEMEHLKAKIDAGADFIITQFFYDTDVFLQFVRRCRQAGISCPILPGIMPIQSFSSFMRMTTYCGISVPSAVMERLEEVKGDDEAVKDIGCDIAIEMCRRILTSDGGVDGVHFYTLNLERSVTKILMGIGVIDIIAPSTDPTLEQSLLSSSPSTETLRATTGRQLPWRPSAMKQRSMEEVRPINWANRPTSYVMRTEDWDEFPNGA